MTSLYSSMSSLWWLIHKDLMRELRAFRVLPSILLLGLVLAFLLASQIDLPVNDKERIIGTMLWSAVVFAGTLALEPSFASERESGCWETLVLYPTTPSVLFLAKMMVNLASITVLELLLIPLFEVLTDVPLLARPGAIAMIAALSNIGFAAVGTMIGAITANLRNRTGLVAVLLIPLLIPVILAAASATSLMLADDIDQQWWGWIQLLGIFATVFTVAGAMVFEFIIEES